MNIGFIGLGIMGAPMAGHLIGAGHSLFLKTRRSVPEALLEAGGTACATAAEVAERSDTIILMLPDTPDVEQVLFGAGGVVEGLSPGKTVIDMSSIAPLATKDFAARVAARACAYLDAPVSGGVRRAVDGTLAILVGGEADLLARWRPVLEVMGTSVLHIGPAGSGHAAKALNNFVSAAGLLATVEALHVAQRFGIAPEAMTDVLNASSGRSNTSENKVKQFMLSGSFASGFSLKLMDKDLGIAGALAQSVDYPLGFGRHCIETWHAIAGAVGPTADHTEMYRLLAEGA